VRDEKDALYATLVKSASHNTLTVTGLLDRIGHELQSSSMNALTRAGQRRDAEDLLKLADWWRAMLVEMRKRCLRLAALASPSNQEGSAIRNEIDQAINARRFVRIKFDYWPNNVGDRINLGSFFTDWDAWWKLRVTEVVMVQHISNVNEYIKQYGVLTRKLSKSASLNSSNPTITTFTVYDNNKPVPDWVPAIAVHPDEARNLLLNVITKAATEKEPSKFVLDSIRSEYLDCVIGLTTNTEEERREWISRAERFRVCYPSARRIEDYLAALLDMITSSVGWFSYARRRHWAYDDNESRSEAVPASILEWHAALN